MPHTRVVLLLLIAPAVIEAQEASTLTEKDFLAAVEGSPPVAAALARERDQAAAEVLRAALLPNPTIEASVEDPDGAARETTAGVTWMPPLDGRRALRREAAEKGLAAAESRLEAARLGLRLELRAIYAEWALAWERRELLGASRGEIGELAGRARARAEAGEISGLAARRLTLEEAQARAELAKAEALLASARAEVAVWHPTLALDAQPSALPLPAAPAAVPDLASRPDLVAREREVERAEALLRLSGRIFEAPALGLGWKRIEEGSMDASGPVISAGWTVPLFDRRQADRREAEGRVTAARAELELARSRVRAEKAGALAAYERLRAEAAEADRAAAEAGDLLTGASAAYQLGESGLTDLLDTLRAVLAARITALEVREAALAAHRDFEAATGRSLSGGLP